MALTRNPSQQPFFSSLVKTKYTADRLWLWAIGCGVVDRGTRAIDRLDFDSLANRVNAIDPYGIFGWMRYIWAIITSRSLGSIP